MRKTIILSLILLCNSLLFGQTFSDVTTDKEIYKFIKKTYKVSSIDSEIIKWKDCEFYKNITCEIFIDYLQMTNDKLLTDSIFADLRQKYESVKAKNIQYFSKFRVRKSNKKYLRISIPLISTDGKYIIIKVNEHCGDECGYGGIHIYEKRKNKWILIDRRFTWIS